MSEDEFIFTDYDTICSELPDDIDPFNTVDTGDAILKSFENYTNSFHSTYKNCFYVDDMIRLGVLYDAWVVIRKISDPDPIYYFHVIMFPQKTEELGAYISAIFSIPENGFDPNTKHIKKESVKDIKIMKDYITFFSNVVNKNFTKSFNINGDCKNGCESYFSDVDTPKPVVNYDSKYIEWFPEKDTDCLSYKQPFILKTDESESESNLPLILGISLGIGIPLLAVFLYLFIKNSFNAN